jgi:hypothetical protein
MSTRKYSVGIKKTKFVLLQSFAEGSEGTLSSGTFASVSLKKTAGLLENMFWMYRVVQESLRHSMFNKRKTVIAPRD